MPTISSRGATWALVHSATLTLMQKVFVFRTIVATEQTGTIPIDYGATS